MTEPFDPLADAIDRQQQIPTDLVAESPAVALVPGTEVVVTFPGQVLTDLDGTPIGVGPSERMTMTVTDCGGLVGWVAP